MRLRFFYGSLIFGVVVGIAIIIFMNPLLRYWASRSETYQYSKDYLFYIAVGAPFILLANTFGHAVRGEGASKSLHDRRNDRNNCQYYFRSHFHFDLPYGNCGAAIATVLGNVFGCAYYLYFLDKKKPVHVFGF